MAKQKTKEYAELRKELEARYRNISKNMEYSPMVGCDTAAGTGNKKKICKHQLYGCIGGKAAHKSEKAKSCTFMVSLKRI